MAIVFISPKKQQRTIFAAATLLLIVVLSIIFLAVFFREIKNRFTVVLPEGVASVPNVKLNFTLVDSDRVAQLRPFTAQVGAEADIGKPDPFVPYYPLIAPKR